jgi:hypothetical protein
MKRKITLLLLLLLSAIGQCNVMAQTVRYVDQSHASADDTNPGTSADAPWKTLNFAKWQTDMTIEVAPGTYTVDASKTINKSGVTVNGGGANSSAVIIQSVSGADPFLLFRLNAPANVTLQNLTIQNVTAAANGAVFNITATSILNLDNVVIKQTGVVAPGKFGGAIQNTGGTLTASNSLFEGCYAAQSGGGGVLYALKDSKNTFTNCRFLNNGNQGGLEATSSFAGGAIYVNESAEVLIESCYFEGNQSKTDKKSDETLIYGNGGALYVRCGLNMTSKLNVSNSTFYNNQATGFSSILSVAVGTSGGNGFTQDHLAFDISLINNTFFNNKGNTGSNKNTNTIDLFATDKVTGNFLLVNNTFLNNNNSEYPAARSIWLPNSKFRTTLINNIFLDGDNAIQADNLPDVPLIRLPVVARGNIISKVAGSIDETNDPELFAAANNNLLNVDNTTVKLAESLTAPATGVPCLALLEGSSAIDNGVSTFTVNSVNVVPALDVRGVAIQGNSKDTGAYEYDIATGIPCMDTNVKLTLSPNPFRDYITLSRPVDTIDFYDLSGRKALSGIHPGTSVYTGNLPKGVYVVVLSFDNRSVAVKLLK